jgi:protein TonB
MDESRDLWHIAEPADKLTGSVSAWVATLLLHGGTLGVVLLIFARLTLPVIDGSLDHSLVVGLGQGALPDPPAEPMNDAREAEREPVRQPTVNRKTPVLQSAHSLGPAVDPSPAVTDKVLTPERKLEQSSDLEPLQKERVDPGPVQSPPATASSETEETMAPVSPARAEREAPDRTAPTGPAEGPDSEPPPLSNPAGPSTPHTSDPAAASVAASAGRTGRTDFGWLAEALWSRVEKTKRYPQVARINHWEGKVVLRAVIREDGELLDLNVARSSGHAVLDEEALASVKQAFPLALSQSLGQPQVALQIPISYRLDH